MIAPAKQNKEISNPFPFPTAHTHPGHLSSERVPAIPAHALPPHSYILCASSQPSPLESSCRTFVASRSSSARCLLAREQRRVGCRTSSTLSLSLSRACVNKRANNVGSAYVAPAVGNSPSGKYPRLEEQRGNSSACRGACEFNSRAWGDWFSF